MSTPKNKHQIWQRLIGDTSKFPLEARIFHSVSIIALIALAYNIPFNYLIGLPLIAVLSFVALLIFGVLYYNSRVRGKTKASIIICGITGYLLFGVNYFYNSGINGPTFVLFALNLYLMIAIAPRGQQLLWLVLNLFIVISLHAIEYLSPQLITDAYPTRLDRFMDSGSAYLVAVTLVFFSLRFIKKNYNYEKRSAEANALEIGEQNKQIILQNQQLEFVNTEKNKLFSIVAHDLRAPLISIQNYLELISEHSLDEDEKRKFEKKLLLATKNTTNMMSNLLSWSLAQMEGVVCKPARHNLSKMLHGIFQVDKDMARKKAISFNYYIDESVQVYADKDMLQLVIRNLVNNAIKFTPKGGTISVEANKIDDRYCQISVKDSGIGIHADRQQEIFSLKAQSTFGTSNEKGVGLGLLLCKEFTELQQGTIWFESTPGTGTSFYLTIPLVKPSASY